MIKAFGPQVCSPEPSRSEPTGAARGGSTLALTATARACVATPSATTLGGPLASLEQDVRVLMRELADARLSAQEGERAHREQTSRLLLGVIDALDALDRVFANVESKPAALTPQMEIWVNNFRAPRLLLERVLTDSGLVRSAPQSGDGFDPYWHRVSGTVAAPDQPSGAIVQVAAPGWIWQGTLLRKCGVVVVHNAEAESRRELVDSQGMDGWPR
jgi:molecular chaperone GrpE